MSAPYIFVAYKPDSSDYCMGCHMASYPSEFVFEVDLSKEELAIAWACCLNFVGGSNECGWEEIRIINSAGCVVSLGREYDQLRELADQQVKKYVATMKQRAADQAEKARQVQELGIARQAIEHEKNERAEYERLYDKFIRKPSQEGN